MISKFTILESQADDTSSELVSEFVKKTNFSICNTMEELSKEEAIFEFKNNKLLLHMLLDKTKSCIHFDLDEGSVNYRAKSVSKNNELISRAIGCKPNYRPTVLDATAGMGRDSFIMAKLGCNVWMQERCLPIYLLLENALARLFSSQPELKENLNLQNINSINSLSDLKSIDVVYLDPMFPSRKKSALVKKEMRLFKELAGEDLDADELLNCALKTKVKRIVVKRPKGAPQLNNLKPSHEIISKNFRFDVYITNQI